MRSEMGTQSRLAAHGAALLLLILLLVYCTPSQEVIDARRGVAMAAAPAAVQAVPVAEPVVVAVAEPTPAVTDVVVTASVPAEAPVVDAPEGSSAPVEPAASVAPQPDESGALVVAPEETGPAEKVVAPLKNANLEVLGDGVYWLSARHDLATELAAIPEIANLIVLAPLPGHAVDGFDHVKTDVIPADPADLTRDAAEQFIYLASKKPGPVVAAALPGARGAAFFKAAYLVRNRNLSGDEVLREIAVELEEAGSSREEVLHRLLRLAGGGESAGGGAVEAAVEAGSATESAAEAVPVGGVDEAAAADVDAAGVDAPAVTPAAGAVAE